MPPAFARNDLGYMPAADSIINGYFPSGFISNCVPLPYLTDLFWGKFISPVIRSSIRLLSKHMHRMKHVFTLCTPLKIANLVVCFYSILVVNKILPIYFRNKRLGDKAVDGGAVVFPGIIIKRHLVIPPAIEELLYDSLSLYLKSRERLNAPKIRNLMTSMKPVNWSPNLKVTHYHNVYVIVPFIQGRFLCLEP